MFMSFHHIARQNNKMIADGKFFLNKCFRVEAFWKI